MLKRTLYSAALSLCLVACATAADDADTGTEDAQVDSTPTDTESDLVADAEPDVEPDADVESDPEPDPVTDPDAEPDAEPDAVPDAEPDVEPDFPFDCEVVGDECESSAIYCVDGENAVGFCSRCGDILRTESCGELEVCEVIDGAGRCRACEGDECPVLDACEANERTCLDYNTVQICGSDGRVDSVADCASGRRCFRGSCGNAGAATGAACEQNINDTDGCNGHTCICGDDFSAEGDTTALCANPAFADGYCTTADCEVNGCDYADETCANFGLSGMFGAGSYCVLNSGCAVRGRSCGGGFECAELPGRVIGGVLEWNWGCWVGGLNTIGDVCTGNDDCLGGDCRVANVGGATTSYCAAPCGDAGTCPSHSTCVEDPDGAGYVCLANSSSADCPRLDTEPLNISPTPPLNRYGAGSQSVCYFAR